MMSEREMTLRYLWEEILASVEAGNMEAARRREMYYSAIEGMTDGDYLATLCTTEKEEEARL